ncbi:MAG: hypothetical protein LBB38_01935 [Puniceicoccales bacterium]|jgi:hypothetical protein|nr:hypothetical protein [Puniceicoccales bacterium]
MSQPAARITVHTSGVPNAWRSYPDVDVFHFSGHGDGIKIRIALTFYGDSRIVIAALADGTANATDIFNSITNVLSPDSIIAINDYYSRSVNDFVAAGMAQAARNLGNS